MTNKIEKLKNWKYINVVIAIIINLIIFIFVNVFSQLKYEQVDDFMMMNLISASDGNFSLYGVFMHPLICGMIILLFKTGININWYSVFMLFLQFISFTVIGSILLEKHKKKGVFLYIIFATIFYTRLLINIQFTTVAAICITAGILLVIYREKRISVMGLALIAIGAMIRFDTLILTLPFLFIYYCFIGIKNKEIFNLKNVLIILGIISIIYISNSLFYNMNPLYREYTKFNEARSYLHDTANIVAQKEDIFLKQGWSKNDIDIFYTYSFADENVYNLSTLNDLKNELENTDRIDIKQNIVKTLQIFVAQLTNINYLLPLIFLLVLTLYNVNTNKENQILIALIFLMTICIHIGFIFIGRPLLRVILPEYIIGCLLQMYFLPYSKKSEKRHIILLLIAIALISIVAIINYRFCIKNKKLYNVNNYSIYKEAIEYTSSHKENAYVYTLSLQRRFLAYSVYEKIPNNTFSNLRPMGDWDTYTQNYYDFKARYNIDNIMTDLYKKDNLYVISGDLVWDKVYLNYIDKIVEYIKEHYNVEVEYEVVKEFNNQIKIYKLREREVKV